MCKGKNLILHITDCANAETQIYVIHLLSVEDASNVPLTYIYIKDRYFWYCKPPKSQGILCEVWRSRHKTHLQPFATHTLPPVYLIACTWHSKALFWDLVTWYLRLPDVLWDTQVGYTQLLC